MPVVLVVPVLPVGDRDLRVKQGEPLVHVQAFLPEPVVERFDIPVPPGFTWWDIPDPDPVLAKPFECLRDKFGSLIAP